MSGFCAPLRNGPGLENGEISSGAKPNCRAEPPFDGSTARIAAAITGVERPISRFQEGPAIPVRVCHETREKH